MIAVYRLLEPVNPVSITASIALKLPPFFTATEISPHNFH
jgi:hypothetical protein